MAASWIPPCQAQVSTLRYVHVVRATDGIVGNVPYKQAAGKSDYLGHVKWKGGCPGGK